MATDKETNKVGLNDVNFLQLGEQPSDGKDETIVEDEEKENQEQEEEETPKPEEEEETETQESETDDGDTSSEETDESEKETKDEEGQEGDDEPSIFQTAAQDIGVELDEDTFGDINFDDPDQNDLAKFIEKSAKQLSNKQMDATFDEYPEAKALVDFAKKGGDPRQYIETMHPQFDYNEVNFDEQIAENEQAQEQLVRNHLAAQDTPQEEIDEMIEDFRNGGILEKQSKRSLKRLQQMQESAQEDLIAEQERKAEEAKQQAEKEQKRIRSLIDETKSFKGLKIPKTDKDDLKNYLFEPVNDDGHSQALVDGVEMSEEERVAIAYLKMKNFDFETLIGNEAETRNSKKLKDQIKKSREDEVSSSKEGKKKSKSGKIQDIKPIF